MKITYDEALKLVVISHQGMVTTIGGEFTNEAEAMRAGEAYLRDHNWMMGRPPGAMKSTVRSRRVN
jgi:hypothetical protein